MGWGTAVSIYVVLWWLVFIAVLPWGIRRNERPEAGHDHGAPTNPRLWRRAAIASVVTLAPFALVYWLVTSGSVTLEDLDWTRLIR